MRLKNSETNSALSKEIAELRDTRVFNTGIVNQAKTGDATEDLQNCCAKVGGDGTVEKPACCKLFADDVKLYSKIECSFENQLHWYCKRFRYGPRTGKWR